MSQDEKQRREGRFSSLTGALRRRQEERLEIDAYQVGDVRTEEPVIIRAGATLIGDLLAPEIVIEGLVYGYVASRQLRVAPGGQIWGDVYVNALELAPTGKINGWVSTLDAGTVDLLRAKELGTGDVPGQDAWPMPLELLEQVRNAGTEVEADQRASQRRSGIWRQLRSEAALALIARSEIEATLVKRLEEAPSGPAAVEDGRAIEQPAAVAVADGALAAADEENVSADRIPGEIDKADQQSAEIAQLRTQLRQAVSAAQKYYSELLWTRAELRAARGKGQDQGVNVDV